MTTLWRRRYLPELRARRFMEHAIESEILLLGQRVAYSGEYICEME